MSGKATNFELDRVVIGPVLQPDDVTPSSGIGPSLPPDLFRQKLAKEFEHDKSKSLDEFEEIDTIGPLIPGQELREEWRHLKSGHSSGGSQRISEKPKRDTWMTELLPVSSDLDASWFTSPTDSNEASEVTNSRLNKEQDDKLKYQVNEAYDQNMAKIASQYQGSKKLKHKSKKHKEKSKKHKHKSKKHKKEHEKSPSSESIRRPFDREKDLKLFRVDTAARKAIIEHSKKLSNRFSHGTQQYL
ncbi:unnamed protein product [Heterobilharzia americana]|nr:unnamed protein product [Heterobilharzia americana]